VRRSTSRLVRRQRHGTRVVELVRAALEAPSWQNAQSVDNTISLGPLRVVVEITCDSDQSESGRARDVCW
jgi:hypothetical protein